MKQENNRKITKSIIDAAQPSTSEYIIWDAAISGFGIKITPAGNKIFLLYYRTKTNRQRKPTIGKYGSLSVDAARTIAQQWLGKIASGEDVSAERIKAKRSETIANLCDRYIVEYAEVYKKPRSVVTDKANIENHVLPLIGNLKVTEVTRADMHRLKDDISKGKSARKLKARPRGRRQIKGGQGISNRVLALMSKMFACAVDWELRPDNPALGIRKFKEQRRDRFLDGDEIYRLTKTLTKADNELLEYPSAVNAIRMLLYTGLRLTEVTLLKWENVNFDRGTICLKDSKTGGRIVPLNGLALKVVEKQREHSSGNLVFESIRNDAPIALTRPWYRIRKIAEIDQSANLHCLRHTFASWAVMNGQSLPQVGALLGHKSAHTTLRYAYHATDALRSYSEQTADVFRKLANNNQ
jgi:integrase